MKKVLTGITAFLLIAGVAIAQDKTKGKATAEKTEKSSAKKECAADCKTTAKGKSCCTQPGSAARLRMAAARKKA
ncbi:MAG TPA: hypothetical protein VM802_03500 [Chitinophaga sp.]|uniref:hypothetical protein n=1 Tax=Chitinophaga sp. TaxID=1869181 RepID=UPI002CD1AA0D|nr:hypothetical protein [Chitinophaga sp.]HVI43899.1 hypothetical protein [Chitinophaga sp.]